MHHMRYCHEADSNITATPANHRKDKVGIHMYRACTTLEYTQSPVQGNMYLIAKEGSSYLVLMPSQ